MPMLVAEGAQLSCSFGTAPSQLRVARRAWSAEGQMVATILDFAPHQNVPPFGMCLSMANPQVAAATAAAQGALTPQPCNPLFSAPWSPGSSFITDKVLLVPVLTDDSTCNCMWGGVVRIDDPATTLASSDGSAEAGSKDGKDGEAGEEGKPGQGSKSGESSKSGQAEGASGKPAGGDASGSKSGDAGRGGSQGDRSGSKSGGGGGPKPGA